MSARKLIASVVVVLAAVVALVVVLNFDGDDSTSAQEVDGAFVSQMVPHHESAIAMAKLARQKAVHPELADLADNIIASQSAEIKQMNQTYIRLFGTEMTGDSHGGLGMDHSMMGMNMDMNALETARPFDRQFIDQMIPHHQGAIRMARVQLSDGQDQQTKVLAEQIIAAQSAEIDQMNAWRLEWYGSESPSGGIPPDDGESSDHSMDAMSHSDSMPGMDQ